MGKSKFKPYIIESLTITNAGSEGKCIARYDDKVVMIDHAVPGDVVRAKVTSSKKSFSFASLQQVLKPSADRIDTFCEHVGMCGGCKWQQMSYEAQLRYKQQQVQDAFERIGKFDFPPIEPIIGSTQQQFYRNKLEYTFTNKRWLTSLDGAAELTTAEHAGLGYHIPGRFDKVFDVNKCWLMDDLQNEIRNAIKSFCISNGYDFYNIYAKEGLMRGIILRRNEAGQWMLIVSFGREDNQRITELMSYINRQFPQITSLLYVINAKLNDTIHDLDIQVFAGDDHLVEKLENLKFKIGPKSFFQTNTMQTLTLYSKAREFAGLTGNENVYDLYTGVGTIALFVSKQARQVVGIEYIEGAIADAKINAQLNGITHTHFYAGDMKDVLSDELMVKHGKPDVIITDPPRAGMHEDVVKKIMESGASRVVYVSCNPATQARDIAWMQDKYLVTKTQPVDMFPHTHHVENITLLTLR
jgi:23S rRNA (uracil1939-C5)-methyltransferase